jgi:hypothetical protein
MTQLRIKVLCVNAQNFLLSFFAKIFGLKIFSPSQTLFFTDVLVLLGIGVAVAAAGTHYLCSQLNQPFQETFSCCSGDKSSPGCQVGTK